MGKTYKSILVHVKTYNLLRQLKIHPREPFNEVILRLLDVYEKYEHISAK